MRIILNDMRYLIFLTGFDQNDKNEFESDIMNLNFEKVKYIYTSDSVVIHLETVRTREMLKGQIHEISEKYSCWYFMSDFTDKLTCNLDDNTARYLFDFEYNQPIEDDFEFDFEIKLEDEEDDDDDLDLVRMLKEKYKYQEQEPTLDEILDKINQKGVSSLSFQEQAILKNYN